MVNKTIDSLGILKSVADNTDLIPIQEAGGTTRHTTKEGLMSTENANYGHSGAVVAGFSSVLPYAITVDTLYNLTSDKLGFLMESPNLDANFKWDASTQRFYSENSSLGGATYLLRAFLTIDLSPAKKGEYVEFILNAFSDSTNGNLTDSHSAILTVSKAIQNKSDADVVADLIFFSDSDTFNHGVGVEFLCSDSATIRKHSIYVARIR